MRKLAGAAAAVALPALLAAGSAAVILTRAAPRPPAAVTQRAARRGGIAPLLRRPGAPLPRWINGVDLTAYGQLSSFTRATGVTPQIVGIYAGLTQPYPASEVRAIAAAGAIPLIQLNPRRIPLAAVAAGADDGLLRKLRTAITTTGVPVWLSFAHEANGPWYAWGCGHVPAPTYIRAWRRVWQVVGTRMITWMWTANRGWQGSRCPLLARWPGSKYVSWVGVDGYLRRPGQAFRDGFLYTIRVLRRLGKPIILSEVGVPAGPGQAARIWSLYTGAARAGCRGVIYFDGATWKGDYAPQASPAVARAFREAARAAGRMAASTAPKVNGGTSR